METILSEWVNLVLRWAHIITGIAWIGSSFLFMWLDSHLEKPDPPRKGVEGELWMTHSGGFYVVEKMDLAPEEVPRRLHWFKWEAAWTWITGFLLLCLMYYYGAEIYLIDREVADLSKAEAIAIGVALLAVSWFVYDGLYKSPLRHRGVTVECIGFALLILVTYGLTQVFSARGAYMHVGAMLGTIMVANVWMIIIPAQQRLVDATKAGTALDARLAFNAKQRSVHNNYMTLPVIFIMISIHYPGTFGHEHAWAVLIVVFIAGALVRHWFNLRNAGQGRLWPIPAAVATILVLIYATLPGGTMTDEDADPVTFAEAYDIVARRCVSCHAARPSDENFDKPPKDVVFDTAEQIRNQAPKIRAVAVLTRTMPVGNETRMTDEERRILGRWIAEGAEIE
ncbi:MAG: urate hydroxylase PuuD [Defluviicoccus sp.]|nr:urate hydroxylase PuuD [Defluviicoccus sp.]